MTTAVNIHASCVVLADAGASFGAPRDAGILILGESGAGKSDLALRLIAHGAVLVADDRCELSFEHGTIWARAPATLAGMIEIRGVGIAPVRSIAAGPIRLAVRLSPAEAIARLPDPTRYVPPAALAAPPRSWPREIAIAPFEASAPAKIAAAAALFAGAIPAEAPRGG